MTNVILNGTKWNEESEILPFAQNDRNQRVTCYRDRDENRLTYSYQPEDWYIIGAERK